MKFDDKYDLNDFCDIRLRILVFIWFMISGTIEK
jgi:hypothetical protein